MMAQKNATPTKEQAEVLEKNGLDKYKWVVIKELTNTVIIRHRDTDEYRVIDK